MTSVSVAEPVMGDRGCRHHPDATGLPELRRRLVSRAEPVLGLRSLAEPVAWSVRQVLPENQHQVVALLL